MKRLNEMAKRFVGDPCNLKRPAYSGSDEIHTEPVFYSLNGVRQGGIMNMRKIPGIHTPTGKEMGLIQLERFDEDIFIDVCGKDPETGEKKCVRIQGDERVER